MGCRNGVRVLFLQDFFKYRCVFYIFDQSFHSKETGEGISEGVFGLFIKPWFKKKKSCYVLLWELPPFSTECCIFRSFLLTPILTNWLVRKRRLSWALRWDLKPTLSWQLGGSRSGSLPLPLETFLFEVEKTAVFVWKTSRTEGSNMRLDPANPRTHSPQKKHRRVLVLHECLTVWKKNKVVSQTEPAP